MNEKFIPPELQETIVDAMGSRPSGTHIHGIGDGLYSVTLPDGQQVIVDQNGNIVG